MTMPKMLEDYLTVAARLDADNYQPMADPTKRPLRTDLEGYHCDTCRQPLVPERWERKRGLQGASWRYLVVCHTCHRAGEV